MATGETGFDDVNFDLVSVQYHALKAGHDYGQYVRDAENAGLSDVADFFREVMEADSQRAHRCHELLARPAGLFAAPSVPGAAVSALARTLAARLSLETELDVDWESAATAAAGDDDGSDGWDLTLAVVALPSIAGDQPLVRCGDDGRCGSALVGLPAIATAPPHPDGVLADVADRLVDTLRSSRFLPWGEE